MVDTLLSLDPITDAKVVNLLGHTSDTPQIYAACGRGPRSSFRTLKHGLDVSPVVASPLPGVPNAVWTVKLTEEGELDSQLPSVAADGILQTSLTHILFFLSPMELWSSRSVRQSKR